MLKENYTLLSTEYSSVRKLEYICDKGHKSSMLSSNWIKGRRCPKCKAINIGNYKRPQFGVIERSFKFEGYVLLSKESDYKNNEE